MQRAPSSRHLRSILPWKTPISRVFLIGCPQRLIRVNHKTVPPYVRNDIIGSPSSKPRPAAFSAI